MKKIRKLPHHKAPDWDNITIEIIKMFGLKLIILLCKFYNDCLFQHYCPPWFKNAFIIPLYKKCEKHLCNNFRSIKSLSILCKIFECIIIDRLHDELYDKLHYCQSWFQKKIEALEQHIFTLKKKIYIYIWR